MRLSNPALFVITALALTPCLSSAASISYVTTLSSIFAGGVDDNYDSATGLSLHAGSCFLQAGGTGPCATLASDPSTNTLGLTAASVAITNGVAFDPNNGISGFGAASASANLAAGTVNAYVSGPNCSVPNASGCDSGGFAAGQIQDSLLFANTTGQTVDINVSWAFDGTTASLGTSPSISLNSLFCLGPGSICGGNGNSALHNPNAGGQVFTFADQNGTITNSLPTTGWISTALVPGSNATSETFQGVFAIPAGVSSDTLNAYLEVSCLISTCDFSHTGSFTLGALPTGVTFTSGSGVLLTQAAPEPGTLTLLLASVALIAMGRRRRLVPEQDRKAKPASEPWRQCTW